MSTPTLPTPKPTGLEMLEHVTWLSLTLVLLSYVVTFSYVLLVGLSVATRTHLTAVIFGSVAWLAGTVLACAWLAWRQHIVLEARDRQARAGSTNAEATGRITSGHMS